MKSFMMSFALTGVILAMLDLVWLGWVAQRLYREQLGPLLESQPITQDVPRLLGAMGVYLLMSAGLVYFAISPATTVKVAVLRGGALALFVYGVYELTNFALIKGWPAKLVWIDLAWGVALFATTCGLVRWLLFKMAR